MGGQCAHAAMGVFFNWMKQFSVDIPLMTMSLFVNTVFQHIQKVLSLDYIEGSFTKVVVEVENEDELLELYNKSI